MKLVPYFTLVKLKRNITPQIGEIMLTLSIISKFGSFIQKMQDQEALTSRQWKRLRPICEILSQSVSHQTIMPKSVLTMSNLNYKTNENCNIILIGDLNGTFITLNAKLK